MKICGCSQKDLWIELESSGAPSASQEDLISFGKLKALRLKRKEWKHEEGENLGIQRRRLLKQLAELDTEREKKLSPWRK